MTDIKASVRSGAVSKMLSSAKSLNLFKQKEESRRIERENLKIA